MSRADRGATLVEVLVATFIGVVVAVITTTLFVRVRKGLQTHSAHMNTDAELDDVTQRLRKAFVARDPTAMPTVDQCAGKACAHIKVNKPGGELIEITTSCVSIAGTAWEDVDFSNVAKACLNGGAGCPSKQAPQIAMHEILSTGPRDTVVPSFGGTAIGAGERAVAAGVCGYFLPDPPHPPPSTVPYDELQVSVDAAILSETGFNNPCYGPGVAAVSAPPHATCVRRWLTLPLSRVGGSSNVTIIK
jgi:hypothetical protein